MPSEAKWKVVDTDPQPGAGHDFKTELALLYRATACGFGDGDLPTSVHPAVVEAYCGRLRPKMQAFREYILTKAEPFFAGIRPSDLPPAVVYPLSVGDLLWSLIVFPDAQEHTILPFESAGDPRRIGTASKKVFEKGLAPVEQALQGQLMGGWNWVRKMEAAHEAGIPEQLTYALSAMVVLDYEPLSLRYFQLKRDGSVEYLGEAEIERLEAERAKAPTAVDPFSSMEIRFRKRGGGPVKIFRHLLVNLTDGHLTADRDHLTLDPAPLAHLEAKGPVSAMARAGAYLLWFPQFSRLRNYLAAHLIWMPSDSTGIPPGFAKQAGLIQETYGQFTSAFDLGYNDEQPDYSNELRQLFADGPSRPLEFFFGYPDGNKQAHLIVTRRP